MIRSKEPSLIDVFSFVDGLNLLMHNNWDADLQNSYYDGWKSQWFSSQILAWDPDGCVIYVFLNAPGRWHDSRIPQNLYFQLLELSQRYLLVNLNFQNMDKSVQGFCR